MCANNKCKRNIVIQYIPWSVARQSAERPLSCARLLSAECKYLSFNFKLLLSSNYEKYEILELVLLLHHMQIS